MSGLWLLSLSCSSCRWTQTATNLQDLYDKLIGDVLIASGVIAYLGAFTSAFRGEVVQEWTQKCKVSSREGRGWWGTFPTMCCFGAFSINLTCAHTRMHTHAHAHTHHTVSRHCLLC